MAIATGHLSKPSATTPTGFAPTCCAVANTVTRRLVERRRRRQMLECYFSPVVSVAARPSAVDRLVLWRSLHGRNRI